MDQELAKADKEVLVEIVKLSQKLGLKGSNGGWKDFLSCHDRQLGASLGDPSKRSADSLIAFLKTFPREEDQKMFLNLLRRMKNQRAVVRRIKEFGENESPLQRLIRLTIEHPQYLRRYSLPIQNEDWVDIPLGKVSKAMKCNTIIAVDCEMVLCEDGSDELVQVCAVDQNLEMKVNMLVKPKKAVIDYRTHITNISPKDLDGVTCSLVDAQKSLKKLLLHGTILAGHGLHNDLLALKIHHPRVIDTSHIFRYANLDRATPSLNDLCKFVLGQELRKEGEPHDCLRDAQAVMKLVLAKLDRGIDNIIIDPTLLKVSNIHMKRLLLHMIPVEVPYKELHRLFSGNYNFEIQGVFKKYGRIYSTFVDFKDPSEAREAFREIKSPIEKDTAGRSQKLVSLQLSTGSTASFYVRYSFHNNETAVDQGRSDCCITEDLRMVKGKGVGEEIDCIVASMKRASELERDDAPMAKKRCINGGDEDPQKAESCGTDEHGISLTEKPKMEDCSKEVHTIFPTEESIPCQPNHVEEFDSLSGKLKQRDDEVIEIQRLKQLLKEREDEIFNLQKIVYDLATPVNIYS